MRAACATAVATAIAALTLAASAAATPTGFNFSSFPKRAVQGDPVSLTVAVPKKGDRCGIGVTYADGEKQSGLPQHAVRNGRVLWAWKVPVGAKTGLAHVSVVCGRSGRLARRMIVVGAVLPPKIDVVKQGFSVRTPSYGGDTVSYGVILANRSKTDDALSVSVLVNFVNSSNVLIGSASTVVGSIRAGGDYALGRSLTFPAAAPVARLEVVVRVAGRQPSSAPPAPSFDNVRVVPELREPVWVGSVEGEITNRAPRLNLAGATISAVVLDEAGNVLGGGYGTASGTLPPGAREFVKLVTGFSAIPAAKAASVRYSVEPTYDTSRT